MGVSIEVSSTAKTKVYNAINDAVSPIVANVYSGHNQANMTLPSVTVDNVSTITVDDEGALESSEFIDLYEITISARVHTAYIGNYKDADGTSAEMADDVITILRDNMNMEDEYRLMRVDSEEFDLEFEESATTGVELIIKIQKVERY